MGHRRGQGTYSAVEADIEVGTQKAPDSCRAAETGGDMAMRLVGTGKELGRLMEGNLVGGTLIEEGMGMMRPGGSR